MKINTIIILLFITTQTFAQQNKFEIGINGGANLSTMRGSSTYDFSYKPGATFSLMFQYNASKMFSIHSNISYENKGTYITFPDSEWSGSSKSTFEFQYITIPVLARLNFGTKAKFFINAGPYIGYLLRPDWVDNSFDFGLTTGIGGQIELRESLILSLELRNNLGLTPITTYYDEFDTQYNNSINLLIGIAYRFGNKKTDE